MGIIKKTLLLLAVGIVLIAESATVSTATTRIEPLDNPIPILGVEPFDNPIFY